MDPIDELMRAQATRPTHEIENYIATCAKAFLESGHYIASDALVFWVAVLKMQETEGG